MGRRGPQRRGHHLKHVAQGPSLGLGSLWIADIFYAHEQLTEHLGKPWKLMAAVALGWSAAFLMAPPRKSVDEVSEFLS